MTYFVQTWNHFVTILHLQMGFFKYTILAHRCSYIIAEHMNDLGYHFFSNTAFLSFVIKLCHDLSYIESEPLKR